MKKTPSPVPQPAVFEAEIRSLLAAYKTETIPLTPLPDPAKVVGLIDHTLLKPEATSQQIRQLCAEARQHAFASVCVNPVYVPLCAAELAGSRVKVATVVGFPLGATQPEVKVCESQMAVDQGAAEIDMVIHIGALKAQDYQRVWRDINGVVQISHAAGALVKVIIETALLTTEEKAAACLISKQAGADFVKTSTGFASAGATIPDIRLMRFIVGQSLGVKAAGGVRNLPDALHMVAAGANRLGSSAGVKIAQAVQQEHEERLSEEGY